jgi:TonB family protein
MPRRWISRGSAAWAAFAALAIPLPATCQVQQAALQTLARDLAQGVLAKGQGTIAVAYFGLAKNSQHVPFELRRELTEEFTAELAHAAPQLGLLYGARLDAALADHGLLSIDKYELSFMLARFLGVEVLVEGALVANGQTLDLRLGAFDLARNKTIAEAQDTLPEPAGWEAAREAPVVDPKAGIYLPPSGGVKFPRCVHCPHPSFTTEAVHEKIQGSVWILITIDANGRVESATALNRIGAGLREAAVMEVEEWKFEPAKTSDGKPVPSRAQVLVEFHLT